MLLYPNLVTDCVSHSLLVRLQLWQLWKSLLFHFVEGKNPVGIRLRSPLFAPVINDLKSCWFRVLLEFLFKAQVCWSDENPHCVFTAVSSPSSFPPTYNHTHRPETAQHPAVPPPTPLLPHCPGRAGCWVAQSEHQTDTKTFKFF